METFRRNAAAADYYIHAEWMQKAPNFNSPKDAVIWLLENKPENAVTLGSLMLSLDYGNKIPEKNAAVYRSHAIAAAYALRREELFSQEIVQAVENIGIDDLENAWKFYKAIKKNVDKKKFTRLNDDIKPEKARNQISRKYFDCSFYYAMELYGLKLVSQV